MAKRKSKNTTSVMVDEEAAFLAAICADPESEVPRLVFSDWLEENGQPVRAEFIRIQCEMARLEEEGRGAFQLARLKVRCDNLLKDHEALWSESLRRVMPQDGYTYYKFRRGFIELIACRMKWFVEEGEILFRIIPLLEANLRRPSMKQIEELGESHHLLQLPELRMIPQEVGEDGMELLVESPRIVNLRRLDLSSNHYDPLHRQAPLMHRAALAIAKSPNLGNLETLDFTNCNIGDAGAVAIAESKYLTNLKELAIIHNPLAPETLELLQSRFGTGLKSNYPFRPGGDA